MSERLAPDALLLQTNLVGVLSAVTDDPDTPDATWLTATSTTAASILRVSFATPSAALAVGAGLQQFQAWVRKTSASGTPTTTLELWENGSLVSTVLAATNITSTTGQLVSATWNASLLTAGSGANVELRLTGTVGGSGGNRATIEVGAVEWNASVVTLLEGSTAGTSTAIAAGLDFLWYLGGASSGGSTAAAGDLLVTYAMVALPTGTSTASASLAVHHPLAGVSNGTSAASAGVGVLLPLATSTSGITTATGNAVVAHPLAGASTGSSTVTGNLLVHHQLVGAVTNTFTVVASVAVAHPMLAGTAGVASVVGDLRVAHPLGAVSAGTSTTTGQLGYLHFLSGASTGATATSANTNVAHPLGGGSAGASTVAGHTVVDHPLVASTAGSSTASADMLVREHLGSFNYGFSGASPIVFYGGALTHQLSGSTAGTATATAALSVTILRELAGSSAGTSSATAATRVTYVLAGSSAGASAGNVAILVGHLLAGKSEGVSTASGTIDVAHVLAGASAGTSTSTGSTRVIFDLIGKTDGVTSVSAAVATNWGLRGLTRGVATVAGVFQDVISVIGIPSEEGIGQPAVGVGSIQPAGVPGTEGVGVPTVGSTTDWWSSAHLYRRKIDVESIGVEMLPAGHSAELVVPAFQHQGKARSDLADLELIFVADGQFHRVARQVTQVDEHLRVRFLLVQPILAATAGRYYLYYGAPGATESGRPAFVDNPWPIQVESDSPMIDYVRPDEHWRDGTSAVPGATATFRFTGTAVRLFGTKSARAGVAQVALDHEPPVRIDYYTPGASTIEELHRWEGLTGDAHKLRVKVAGQGRAINVMSFEYVAPVTVTDLGEEVLVEAWSALVMSPVGG